MVVGAQPQPQPQQQQPVSAEEENLKRNTDCVYFLASPLTCKKGSECEYRHSDYARMNPRDCWYWMNSTCLNPKCPFRHPPIEGLLGTQATAPSVPSASSSQAPAVAAPPAGQGSSKPACIYFQKGYCMKGDKCPFSHGPNLPAVTKVTQPVGLSAQVSELSTVKKAFGSLQKSIEEQKTLSANPVGAHPAAISRAPKFATAPVLAPVRAPAPLKPSRNGVSVERNPVLRAKALDSPVMNGISTHRPVRSRQGNASGDYGAQNSKDADDFLRESSPGFDVLVEDELGDQDYFHDGEDQYGRSRGHDGRNSNLDEYDADHLAMAEGDRGRFWDPRGYESYDRVQGQQHAWEPRRASAEPAQYDRRGYRKSNSPDNDNNGSDLRHRLSQQRRVNGLRSVVNDDRKYRNSSRVDRDLHQSAQGVETGSKFQNSSVVNNEGPLSSRLRGRINFGSASNTSRGRRSPPPASNRPQVSGSYPGRFGDRLKGRAQDDHNANGRSFRGSRDGDFSGPKSLSELKGKKEGHEDREKSVVLGKRKNTSEASKQHEGEASFEGPMSLSEILKRKRGAAASAGGETEQSKLRAASVGGVVGSEAEKVEDANQKEMDEEGMIYDNNDEDENDEAVAADDQELEAEADDEAHGEYDYEEEYDNENPEGEEEYLEDEDDDFAKKIGVLSS